MYKPVEMRMNRWMLAAAMVVAPALGAACDTGGSREEATESSSAARGGPVDGAEAQRLVQAGATLLDVRTPGEFAGGHIDGALNLPVSELSGRMGEIPRDQPVVVYCLSGARSSSAAGMLREAGYTAHDLGPMDAWR